MIEREPAGAVRYGTHKSMRNAQQTLRFVFLK